MKRILTLFLAILMALPMLTVAAQAETSIYQEKAIELPDGFSFASAMSATPDGGFAVVSRSAQGKWALIAWDAMNATPTVTELAHQGHDIEIEHLSIAPDGSILLALSPLPPLDDEGGRIRMAPGGAAPEGEPQEGGRIRMTPDGALPEGGEGEDHVAVMGFSDEFLMDDELLPEGAVPFSAPDQQPEGAEDAPIEFMVGPDDMKTELLWLDASGAELARFHANGFVFEVKALANRKSVAVVLEQGTNIYDDTGAQLVTLGSDQLNTIAANGDVLCAIEEGKLNTYNPETGEKTASMSITTQGSPMLSVDADGKIFMLDTSGTYALDFISGEQQLLMDPMGTFVGDPSNGILGFTHTKDGTLVVLVEEGAGYMGGMNIRISAQKELKLFGYEARSDIDPNSRTDFSITALRTSPRLQKAASDFQRLHPELNVKLQTQMSLDDESPIEDHIRTLNTDLLAGKGGDVLVLDDLPMDKYAEKGILMDLTGLFDDVDILSGLRKAMTTLDGKIYSIPSQFEIDLLWGKKELIDQVHTLSDIEKLSLPAGQVPFAPRTVEDWLKLFYPASEGSFKNSEGTIQFDSPKFAEFLTALQSIYARQGEMPDDALIANDPVQTEVLAMMNGASALFANRFSGSMDSTIGYSIAGAEDSECTALPTIDGESRGIVPSLKLGIGSTTNQQTLAEEFIRLMFSSDIQKIETGEGLPTSLSALDKLFADALELSQNENVTTMLSFGGTPIVLEQPNERILARIRTLINEADQQINIDNTLIGFIAEESEGFLNGEEDASAVATAIAQRAWSYLNE